MANPHLDNGIPWSGVKKPSFGAQQPAVSFSSQQGGPSDEYFDRPMGGGSGWSPTMGGGSGYNPGQDPRPNIGLDRMGIMSQPGGYGSDTYNALVGGLNKQRQGGGPQHSGLWQDIKRILNKTKNPGPLIDQWTDRWNEQQTSYNVGDTYPDYEMLMAELTQEQMEHMQASDPIRTNLTRQELFNQVKDMEYGGTPSWLGGPNAPWGSPPQEPTTQEEYDDYYKWLEGGGSPYGSEPSTKSYWQT